MTKFSFETRYEIWNDDDGYVIKIGPDADGLGLIDVREIEADGKEVARLTFLPEQAELIAKALLKAVADLREAEAAKQLALPLTAEEIPFK